MEKKYDKRELVKMILQNDEDIDEIDEETIHLLVKETVSKDVSKIHEKTFTFGDRAADKMAEFAGSWTFILSFASVIILWILINVNILKNPFDPFPFILLNLVLSCVAALQAPVIMMSQNRQEEKDRIRAKNDYKVNLKSEFIIEDLHNKLDQLLENQQDIYKKLKALEEKKN